jgi:spermidine/putrescine transport system ATP-binding protein
MMSDIDEVTLVDVTKRFGGHVAVDAISLAIRRGEFFSLLGPSGCGKTTTLRMISGFEFPTAGRIEIAGKLVNDVPAHRRNTNLIFQHLALFPHLDVFDNVAFGLRVKHVSRRDIEKRVLESLEVVGLGGLHRRRVSQISGGQQQRVAIARALVNEPAVLLLDEPLGALDLKLRMQMQIELKSLQHRVGTTFIYVTHDQGEALVMSDRIAVMSNGRVEQLGSGRDIYLRPQTAFVAAFIGETNLLHGNVRGVDGDLATVSTASGDIRAAQNGPLQERQQVTVSLRPEIVRLQQLSANGASADGLRGTIGDVIFLGSQIRYEVALASGELLKVDRPIDERILSAGDEIVASWDPQSVVVLSDNSTLGDIQQADSTPLPA